MNIKYKMGPRLKPCGTPEVAEYSFDSNPPYCTNCLLFSKYDSIKASKFEEKALCSNFVSKKVIIWMECLLNIGTNDVNLPDTFIE